MKKEQPEVALVIAAYNEEDCIIDKVQNCFALDYPKDKLKIFIVTDGSTDNTFDILNHIDGIKLYHRDFRQGKLAAIERVMKYITSPIVILTDANCILNRKSIERIVSHYGDPFVGGVAGEKSIMRHPGESIAGAGEGLYWKYESWLKKTDSELHSVVGAAGELFSFRRNLFESLPPDTIIEDFVLSLRIAMKGFRIVYEPGAIASEVPSASMRDEWKRKVRICAGGFQSLRYLPGIWNPFRYGWLSIQFLSHRFLRWAVIPFLLPLIFIMTSILAMSSVLYRVLLGLELIFLTMAIIALLFSHRFTLPKIIMIPAYLAMMNAAAYAGLLRYLKGNQSVIWEKANRMSITN